LFDDDREGERLTGKPNRITPNKMSKINLDFEDNLERDNKYHVIACAKSVECFLINKLIYLKYMYSLSNDKAILSSFVDKLVIKITNFKFLSLKTDHFW
jgi:hypothetical protein